MKSCVCKNHHQRGSQRQRVVSSISLALALLLPETAIAQESTPSGRVYEPSFFAEFSPRTALDMIDRLPGFNAERGDDQRGLGQGGANVLINGARAAGKSDIFDQLSRISARNVVRIEILDGAALDIPGLSGQVANVIVRTSGISGTWEWEPVYEEFTGTSLANGSVAVSGEQGNFAWSAELEYSESRRTSESLEELFFPDGTLFERRDDVNDSVNKGPAVSVDFAWEPAAGQTVNLTADYRKDTSDGLSPSVRTELGPPVETRLTEFVDEGDDQDWSLSADYAFPVATGNLKLIGFISRSEASSSSSRITTIDGTRSDLRGNGRDSERGETIARAEYSWSPAAATDWQLGVESAYNFLDTTGRLFGLDENGNVVEQPFIGGTSRVEEDRAEATLSHQRALTGKWNIQGSIGVEHSRLSQSGANGQEREFVRPKGFLSSTYKPVPSLSIRTRLAREVGQLDFGDFVSSVSLRDDLDTTGNPDLVPEQTWRGEIEFDKRFDQGGRASVEFFAEQITDLVDRVPVGTDGDAVGNIDEAYRYGVQFNGTAAGERFGMPGVEIDLTAEAGHSQVDDPLTGERRQLNRDLEYLYSINYRHDVPETLWAYGFSVFDASRADSFRSTSVSSAEATVPRTDIFLEYKDFNGIKINVSLENVLDRQRNSELQRFSARRDSGVLESIERENSRFGRALEVEISGTF